MMALFSTPTTPPLRSTAASITPAVGGHLGMRLLCHLTPLTDIAISVLGV